MRLEAATLRSLDHTGVARWADSNSDATHDDEELYLVTEYVNGPTLSRFAQSKPQSKEVATAIVIGLLEVLSYCHNRGPVHRDIKPDNIVLRDGDPVHPVLLDFGLTFNADLEPEGLNTPDHKAIGSKFLRLPEFDMQGTARLSPVVDVTCAVGVLFFLLTSEIPRVLRDEHGQMPHRRPGGRARLESQLSGHLAILDSIFDVGFAYEQYARWKSCELLLSEMRRLQQSTGEPLLSFAEEIKARRRTLAENPVRRIELQKKSIDDLCRGTGDAVYHSFFDETKGDLIAENPSQYVGERFFGVTLVDAADTKRRATLNIHRFFQDNEVAIVARVKLSAGGVEGEISSEPDRISLFDPNMSSRITVAIQRAFMFAWENLGIPGS
jgi:serine/threonine-protein kinase